MSCPDWQTLCARREAGPGDGPGWQSALEHLGGCGECEGRALAADPLLLFRRLPALDLRPGETQAMKLAVAGMRRGETIAGRRSVFRRSWLAAAAAAVFLGSLLLSGAVPRPGDGGEPQVMSSPAAGAAAELDLEWMPLVETVDPTYGSLIQLVGDDISVVVVLPSSSGAAGVTGAKVAYPDA